MRALAIIAALAFAGSAHAAPSPGWDRASKIVQETSRCVDGWKDGPHSPDGLVPKNIFADCALYSMRKIDGIPDEGFPK